jgi:hypothetical protein
VETKGNCFKICDLGFESFLLFCALHLNIPIQKPHALWKTSLLIQLKEIDKQTEIYGSSHIHLAYVKVNSYKVDIFYDLGKSLIMMFLECKDHENLRELACENMPTS